MMKDVNVVLYRPIYPRNIGMCARAMANMGVERLVLIAPQTELTEEAKQGAAHAQDILRKATIYESHEAFLASEGGGVRIALSGREGNLMRPQGLDELFKTLREEKDHPVHDLNESMYLIFGPEDYGLSNEDMELCHYVCRLPVWGEITSLNISHAVLLTLYMVRAELLLTPKPEHQKSEPWSAPPRKAAYYPTETIKKWLEALGFDLSARRVSIEKTLNRILLSRSPTQEELRIVDSVLQQTVRKLNTASSRPKKDD